MVLSIARRRVLLAARFDFRRCTGAGSVVRRPRTASCAHAGPDQRADSDEIVRGIGEGKDPPDFLLSSMMQLAQPADRLAPSEALFDQLPFHLAHGEAGMSGGAPINGARRSRRVDILSYVWRGVARARPSTKGGASAVPVLFRARRQSGSVTD